MPVCLAYSGYRFDAGARDSVPPHHRSQSYIVAATFETRDSRGARAVFRGVRRPYLL
jgi:hypothetical protein